MSMRGLVTALLLVAATATAAATPVDDAYQFIDYASAAFCDEPQVLRWDCSSAACKLTGSVGTNATAFYTTVKSGTNAYTAYNTRQQVIIAAFRGTDNTRNLIQDLRFRKTAYTGAPADVEVHKGFYAAWQNTAEPIVQEIQRLRRLFPSFRVVCVGHSFGGALSNHCAADLRSRGINATSITYGGPRIGNDAWAAYYNSVDPGALRVTSYNDVFPQLPPRQLSYRHHPTEIWTNAAGQLVVCDRSGEDPNCLNSIPATELSADAHNYYLGYTFGTCYLA